MEALIPQAAWAGHVRLLSVSAKVIGITYVSAYLGPEMHFSDANPAERLGWRSKGRSRFENEGFGLQSASNDAPQPAVSTMSQKDIPDFPALQPILAAILNCYRICETLLLELQDDLVRKNLDGVHQTLARFRTEIPHLSVQIAQLSSGIRSHSPEAHAVSNIGHSSTHVYGHVLILADIWSLRGPGQLEEFQKTITERLASVRAMLDEYEKLTKHPPVAPTQNRLKERASFFAFSRDVDAHAERLKETVSLISAEPGTVSPPQNKPKDKKPKASELDPLWRTRKRGAGSYAPRQKKDKRIVATENAIIEFADTFPGDHVSIPELGKAIGKTVSALWHRDVRAIVASRDAVRQAKGLPFPLHLDDRSDYQKRLKAAS